MDSSVLIKSQTVRPILLSINKSLKKIYNARNAILCTSCLMVLAKQVPKLIVRFTSKTRIPVHSAKINTTVLLIVKNMEPSLNAHNTH